MTNEPESDLKSRIEAAKDGANSHNDKPPASPYNTPGARAGTEFMAHVIAGALLGWGLDSWLGTAPLLIVLMLLAGFGTGIWRSSKILSQK